MENLMTGALVVIGCVSGLNLFNVRLDPDPKQNNFLYAVLFGVAYGLAVSICLARLWR